MLFNSIAFVFFFLGVTTTYFLLPYRYRWLLLLGASCYFYMAFVPIYILILGFTIVIDYFAGRLIENAEGKKRKFYLIISLVANIGVLAVFKYWNFLNDNLTALLEPLQIHNPVPALKILLPIGLSFHTFQAMSYTIEVYRGNQKAEKHFGIYSLFVMFYPQLVSGPIERPQNLLPQFRQRFDFDTGRIAEGLRLMLWGFFKKIVIADRLALYVDQVYNNPEMHSGNSMILATIFFSFQLYCDFSAYSDIAIGAARVMGFKLMTNFKRPYFSTNMAEFWKRWHVSLSTWFKDYLYIPLGGRRVSVPRWYFNLMVVFLLSGLWHGADWTYIIWGGLNGFYIVFAIMTKKIRDKINTLIGIKNIPWLFVTIQIVTTFVLCCFSRIFFRASNLSDASLIIKKIFTDKGPLFIATDPSILIYSVSGIGFLMLIEAKWEYYKGSFSFYHNNHWVIKNLSYAFLIIMILLVGVFDGGQFIYFQF